MLYLPQAGRPDSPTLARVMGVGRQQQQQLIEFVFDSVYVDLLYNEIFLTFTAASVSLCCVCGQAVVFGLSVRLSWYPMWMLWLRDCDACTVVCVACTVVCVACVRG